jgi:hypothetical protein
MGIGINNSFRYSESIEVIAIIIVTANKNIDKDASLFLPLMLPLSLLDNIIFLIKNIDSKRTKCEINIIFIITLPFLIQQNNGLATNQTDAKIR